MVDTNCLLASINPRGVYFHLYELFIARAFKWVISNEILTGYDEPVTRRCSVATAQQVHEVLLTASNTHFQETNYKWQLIEPDPDDNKFMNVSVAANADFPVANDRHFEVLRQVECPRVPIISLQAFLADFR